jgi:hypothetical protein
MKTLTAKLAVAALLVAGATVKAETNPFVAVGSTALIAWNVNDATKTVSANWSAAQASKNKTKLQRGLSTVTNYALPAVQVAAAALLAVRANDLDGRTYFSGPESKLNVTQTSALVVLTGLTLGKHYWNNRTAAQQAADAAVVSAVEAAAASAQAAVSSSTATSN